MVKEYTSFVCKSSRVLDVSTCFMVQSTLYWNVLATSDFHVFSGQISPNLCLINAHTHTVFGAEIFNLHLERSSGLISPHHVYWLSLCFYRMSWFQEFSLGWNQVPHG